MFNKNWAEVPCETIAAFDKVDDMVQTWNDLLFGNSEQECSGVNRKRQPE